jgi:hypothetical protein
MSAKLEPTSDMPVTFKNWRLVNSDMTTLLVPQLRGSVGSETPILDAHSGQYKLREMRRGSQFMLPGVAVALFAANRLGLAARLGARLEQPTAQRLKNSSSETSSGSGD